jgi:hypothetical protein
MEHPPKDPNGPVGKHAHVLVVDDPVNPQKVMSEEDHARLRAWWDKVRRSFLLASVIPSRLGPVEDPVGDFQPGHSDFEVTELPLPIVQKDSGFQIPGLDAVKVRRLDDFTTRVLDSWDTPPVVYGEPQPDIVVERKGE